MSRRRDMLYGTSKRPERLARTCDPRAVVELKIFYWSSQMCPDACLHPKPRVTMRIASSSASILAWIGELSQSHLLSCQCSNLPKRIRPIRLAFIEPLCDLASSEAPSSVVQSLA